MKSPVWNPNKKSWFWKEKDGTEHLFSQVKKQADGSIHVKSSNGLWNIINPKTEKLLSGEWLRFVGTPKQGWRLVLPQEGWYNYIDDEGYWLNRYGFSKASNVKDDGTADVVAYNVPKRIYLLDGSEMSYDEDDNE